MVHEVQYLLRFFKWGSKLSGLDCGEKIQRQARLSQRSSGMGDHPRSPGYRVKASEVMIATM